MSRSTGRDGNGDTKCEGAALNLNNSGADSTDEFFKAGQSPINL